MFPKLRSGVEKGLETLIDGMGTPRREAWCDSYNLQKVV